MTDQPLSQMRVACLCGWRGIAGDTIISGDDKIYCPECGLTGTIGTEAIIDGLRRKQRADRDDVLALLDQHFASSASWRFTSPNGVGIHRKKGRGR